MRDTHRILELRGIRKRYGGVQAVDGIDLTVEPGKVLAIVGENGAGKSTLMKILVGAEQPDEGQILIGGEQVSLKNVADAVAHGINIVFQELSLYPAMDVLSNLFMPRPPVRGPAVSRRTMRRLAEPALRQLEVNAPVNATLGDLPLDQQQLIEIARSLLSDIDFVVLDEPNSALNAAETERLFKVVRRLRDDGVGVIYISHRLEEVFDIADDIVVIRNGRRVFDSPIRDTSIPDIVRQMTGRNQQPPVESVPHVVAESRPAVSVENVSVGGQLTGASLELHRGEVVGLAGLEGSGFRSIIDLLFGMASPTDGSVRLFDGAGEPRNMRQAVRRGIALVPRDRRTGGLMLERSIADNMSLVATSGLGRDGRFISRKMLAKRANQAAESYSIKMGSPWMPVNGLSGGNQQKVVLAKWLVTDPDLILLDDPTRGVDVGSKEELYGAVRELAREGKAVLFTSSELNEYLRVCDRIYVFYRGRICGQTSRDAIDEHTLLEAVNTGRLPPSVSAAA